MLEAESLPHPSANFQEGMSDDSEKSGYCYEYLQRISDYTGWEYEYVYGEWAELYEKLLKCEIDVLGGVSYTEDRGKYINFPNYAIGSDNYYLFQHSDKQTINAKNPDSFEGKKIGCIKNNRMTVFLEEWLKKINAKPILVYYDGFTERDKDFNSNKIDALTATDYNVTSVNNYSPVVKIGEEPFFLAVNKNRTDILMELNSVHSFLVQLSPSFLETLQYKSYGKTLANSNLSLE